MRSTLAVLLVLALALACSRESPRPPDVVLITVDTLRADHLGAYGSTVAKTPVIDALAAEGLVFLNAVAPLPETLPSHLTLLTSLYPRDHGVLSNAAPLPGDAVTLAHRFAAAGYATAAFAACGLFQETDGEVLGFEHFDVPEKPQRGAHEVVPRALTYLAERDAAAEERPLFLWLHLFDPHMPYAPPPPWNGGADPALVEEIPHFAWPRLLRIAEANGGDLPRRVFDRARELYAGEVEHVDYQIGRFLEAFRLDKTVLLLTSDHGECFEGGVFFDHSQCLGEGALAVPMILRYPPGVAAGRVEETVEHLDVAPTLLALAGLEVPGEMKGMGLLKRRLAESTTAFFQHPIYRRSDVEGRQEVLDQLRSVAGEPTSRIVGDRGQVGARRGSFKYLRRGAEEALYDLSSEGGERVDLAPEGPEELRELRLAVRRFLREHPVQVRDVGDLDPELLERLRALGYLGPEEDDD